MVELCRNSRSVAANLGIRSVLQWIDLRCIDGLHSLIASEGCRNVLLPAANAASNFGVEFSLLTFLLGLNSPKCLLINGHLYVTSGARIVW